MLVKYNNKRNFKKTSEPVGKISKENKKRFVVQHHIARKDHYDFRLEFNGVLISFAIPKGPSYNPKDKRLSIHVEDHPLSYRNFEGIIPKGEYGAGTVMLWDNGTYEELENFKTTFKKGYLKFKLNGKRLKGTWSLIKFKDDNWLLIKEKDNIKLFDNINEFNTSIKSGKTMDEISDKIKITNPDKIMYKKDKITKNDIVKYYEKISKRMLPYLENRILSTVRCPDGIDKEKFFKKHFDENKYLKRTKNNYYYINNLNGLISEVQMNSIEFHITNSNISDLNHPNIMVFDLDPDKNLSLDIVRDGVKDLKKILDDLKLKSYLKTSGGKGYHILVPIKDKITHNKCKNIAKNITKLLENTYPNKYTSNMRFKNRKNKIFIDYFRNSINASCVCPYSLRARDTLSISMPIKWNELDKVKPDEINIKEALKRLKRIDPWKDFFN